MDDSATTMQALLESRTPLFFPDGTIKFKTMFRQRWYSNCRKRGLYLRTADGEYQGQRGVFIWTEEKQ
jgi:hypothetical protein